MRLLGCGEIDLEWFQKLSSKLAAGAAEARRNMRLCEMNTAVPRAFLASNRRTEWNAQTPAQPMDPEMVTEAETVAEAFLMARDSLATLKASRAKLVRSMRRAQRDLFETAAPV